MAGNPNLKSITDLANFTTLIKVEVSADQLSAYVPAGSPINAKVLDWNYDDLRNYLHRWGFVSEPMASDFEELQEKIAKEPEGLSEDFILLKGTPPTQPLPARVEYLNKKPIPEDLAVAQQPFLKIIQPEPAQPGMSVYGTPVAPPSGTEVPDPIELDLGEGITLTPEGLLICEFAGKITVDLPKVKVDPGYEISDPTLPEYKVAEFPCAVKVKGDLVGALKWRVIGSFHVEGHLSASNISVYGDAIIDSGVQISSVESDAVLKIYGNLRTTYIQFSKVGIAKDAFIDCSIVQSEVRVGGNIICRGDPGTVIGSEITCFGAIIANKVGADKGKRTRISIYRRSPSLRPPRTKIALLCKDTRMRVFGEVWTQKDDLAYESPEVP